MSQVEEDGLDSVAQVRSNLAELCQQMRSATQPAQYYYFRAQYDEILDILASNSRVSGATKAQRRRNADRRRKVRLKHGIEAPPEARKVNFDDKRSPEEKRKSKLVRYESHHRERQIEKFKAMRASGERFPSKIEGPEVCTYYVRHGDLICRRYSYSRALTRLLARVDGKRCFFNIEEAQANSAGGFFYACPYGRHWHRTSRGDFPESFTV